MFLFHFTFFKLSPFLALVKNVPRIMNEQQWGAGGGSLTLQNKVEWRGISCEQIDSFLLCPNILVGPEQKMRFVLNQENQKRNRKLSLSRRMRVFF